MPPSWSGPQGVSTLSIPVDILEQKSEKRKTHYPEPANPRKRFQRRGIVSIFRILIDTCECMASAPSVHADTHAHTPTRVCAKASHTISHLASFLTVASTFSVC